MAVVGFDHEREAFGNADGRDDFERSAGFGEIAHRAIEGSAAAKRDLAGLQQPSSWCYSVLVHHMDLRLNRGMGRVEVTMPLPHITPVIQRKVVGFRRAVFHPSIGHPSAPAAPR